MKIKFFNYFTIWLSLFDYLPYVDVKKKNDAKNKGGDEEIWKNEFEFWSFYVKIRLHDNFHEYLRRKNSTYFLRHFLLIETEMNM